MSHEKSVASCHAQKTYKEDKPEATASLADVKESSVQAALAADLPKIGGIFCKWRRTKNSTGDFSVWITCFDFTPDSILMHIGLTMAIGMQPMSPPY